MRSVVALFLLFAVAVVCGAAPLLNANSSTVVNGSYIVVLKTSERSSRDAHVMELRDLIAEQNDASVVRHIYSIGSMLGFSARLSQNMLNQQLNNPNVKYIEADQVVKGSFVTQDDAVWGLARISGVKNTQSTTYYYNSSAGAGVDVYVIDTGIYTKNEDFGSRAKAVFNAIDYENGQDLNGHGTHCAGTIGGTTYGVAKKVSLKGVKVLDKDGSGTIESVVAGVNYVTNERSQSRPTVASMSLGGGASKTIDDAVEESIASGIVYAIAAGNENDDACYSSPARVPSAVTVGATDSKDKRATFSNWGDCVDIFAPGVSIKSDWIGDKDATKTISGTSMATPHVAGVLALHLGENPSLSPKESGDWLRSVATQGLVINPESANYLLFAPSF